MFRCALAVARIFRPIAGPTKAASIIYNDTKTFSSRTGLLTSTPLSIFPQKPLHENKQILDISSKITPIQIRTVTKFSLRKGKRKTVKAALKRFYRLDWGGWIRPKVGRHKKMWKKSAAQKRRLRQHVFCTATQSTMLDKMVTKFWKRPKYYVDNPYAPYHTREEFYNTRKKPVLRE